MCVDLTSAGVCLHMLPSFVVVVFCLDGLGDIQMVSGGCVD